MAAVAQMSRLARTATICPHTAPGDQPSRSADFGSDADNPGATVARLTELSGRSRSSTVLSIKRLKEAGLVNHGGHGSWAAIEDDPEPIDEEI
jgi:hypothetical protein